MSQLSIKVVAGNNVTIELQGDSSDVQKIYRDLLNGDLYLLANLKSNERKAGNKLSKIQTGSKKTKLKRTNSKKFVLSIDQQTELKTFIDKLNPQHNTNKYLLVLYWLAKNAGIAALKNVDFISLSRVIELGDINIKTQKPYLKNKSGYIQNVGRGEYALTEKGVQRVQLLIEHPVNA